MTATERKKQIQYNVILANYVELEITYHVQSNTVYKYKTVNLAGESVWYEENSLRFHKDWNWLMTVVTKIARDNRHNSLRYLFTKAVGDGNIEKSFENAVSVISEFRLKDIEDEFKAHNHLIRLFYTGSDGQEKTTCKYHEDMLAISAVALKIINECNDFANHPRMTDLLAAGTTYDIREIYPAVIAFIKRFNENKEISS